MTVNKIIIIFGLLLVTFGAVIFYQLNTKSALKTTGKVTIGSHTFNVEVVKNSKDKQIGLTKYPKINADQGMLFIFDTPATYSFWMKNMKFPLDIVFIKNDKVISFVQNVKPTTSDNPPTYNPDVPSNYVLEINAGLVKKNNIKKGDTVKIQTQ